jgi:hypothetical protein
MALLAAAIAVPLRLTSRHLTRAYDGLSAAVGLHWRGDRRRADCRDDRDELRAMRV